MTTTPETTERTISVQLAAVFQSYRGGTLRQSEPEHLFPRRDFDALRRMATFDSVPVRERLPLHQFHTVCSRGLIAARRGELADSGDAFREAEEQLPFLETLSAEAWLLAVSTYEAGLAYLDFRLGDPQAAEQRLNRAMDADWSLELKGFPVMQVHRIQQGHNFSRMAFQTGQRDDALRLGGLLLGYLEGQSKTLPYHRDWLPDQLQHVPRYIRRSMIHQIIGEMANRITTGQVGDSEWHLLIGSADLLASPEDAVFPQIQIGLQAVAHRLNGDDSAYLDTAEAFFSYGIRECHMLWYSLLLDLVDFCGAHRSAGALKLRDILYKDSKRWKGFPPFLQQRMAATMAATT